LFSKALGTWFSLVVFWDIRAHKAKKIGSKLDWMRGYNMQGLILRGFCGLLFLTALSGVCTNSVNATELKVHGDRVILRAAPSDNSEIVGQMSDGDILETETEKDIDGEWIKIIPPERVNFWVYGELVKEGVVLASKVQIRVGPGINYRSVGEIGKDTKISIRGEYREWLKISPPSGCRLWVNRKYVDPVDKAVVVETSKVAKETGNSPEKKVATTDKSTVLSKQTVNLHISQRAPDVQTKTISKKDLPALQSGSVITRQQVVSSPEAAIRDKLVSSREQGHAVQYGGILRYAGLFVWRQPSRYRLVVHDNNGVAITLCHVLGDEKQLLSMQDKTVTIQGREYWVQGVRQSVVIPDKILQNN